MRNRAGVYARLSDNRPVIAVHGPFHDQLGLCLTLEHHLHGEPELERLPRPQDEASQAAWQRGQLDLLTAGELLGRLRQRRGPWVLGLSRPDSRRRLRFYVYWQGEAVTCAGLASRLSWVIARDAIRSRLRCPELEPDPEAVIRDLVAIVQDEIDHGGAGVGFTAGLTALLEHAMAAWLEQPR